MKTLNSFLSKFPDGEEVLESISAKGQKLVHSARDKATEIAADICHTDTESLRRFGSSIGKLAVEMTQLGVQSLVKGVTEKITGKPVEKENVEILEGRKLVVWLVHPTNYRTEPPKSDEYNFIIKAFLKFLQDQGIIADRSVGTPRKFKKQILPTNALGQLKALLPKEIQDGENTVPLEVHVLEDGTQPFDDEAIEQSMKGENVQGVVMLCGIQTNQSVRALHLAERCRKRGIQVIAGGYHIRADLPVTQRQAADLGMSLAIGEGESQLPDGTPFLQAILKDALAGNLQPEYRQIDNPNIDKGRLPQVMPEYQKQMINPAMATLETSRGCPYPCKFCTIRTIGGTDVRARDPETMKGWIKDQFEKNKIETIFITDDNFAKSDQRFEVLKLLAELRQEGIPIRAMVQVDTTATIGKEGARFVEACQKAGVYTVFLGIESVDPATLKDMNKPQNHPKRYQEMIDTWHKHNILTQCGFILGNAQETPGVGRRSAKTLIDMGIDVAAAYVLTPLPGSVNYHEFHAAGNVIEPDFNSYDSHSRAYLQFPGGLTPAQLKQEYRDFYDEFFHFRNLPRLAERLEGTTLIAGLRQWFWYKIAISKGDHPMYSGWGELPPDYRRSDFDDKTPSIKDLAPRADGVGAPSREKNKKNLKVLVS